MCSSANISGIIVVQFKEETDISRIIYKGSRNCTSREGGGGVKYAFEGAHQHQIAEVVEDDPNRNYLYD